VHGDAAEWSIDSHLLALIADIGQIANWQRTENGSKGRNVPKPIRRPGDPEPVTHTADARSVEETRALLKKMQAAARKQEKKKGGG
jgi:hypothetical protein